SYFRQKDCHRSMFIPELGITLPPNRFPLGRVAVGLLLVVAVARAQTPAPQQNTPSSAPGTTAPNVQTPSSAAPAQAPGTPPPNSAPAAKQPAPNQPAAAPAPNQPAGGSANTQGQGQPPVGEENGGFVFRAEAREVTLHASVVDDRNHLVTNL